MNVHGEGLLEDLVNQGVFSLGKQIGQSEHVETLLKIDIPACSGQRRCVAKQVLGIFPLWRECIVLKSCLLLLMSLPPKSVKQELI